jgi:hypothetical protein
VRHEEEEEEDDEKRSDQEAREAQLVWVLRMAVEVEVEARDRKGDMAFILV